MKKLALALVCLVSVAFFASCNPISEPTIAVITGENYVYDGASIDLGTNYQLGFRAASNSQTMKELAKFNLVTKIYDMEDNEYYSEDTTFVISGTEYVYEETIGFTRDLVGKVIFTATVTDVDGQFKTAVINLNVNQAAVPVEEKDVNWQRKGSNLLNETETEMAAYGLKWVARDAFHANIQPLNENCKLYVVENNAADFNAVTTDVEKANFFNRFENVDAVTEYRNINVAVNGDKDYNDILAVIDAQGNKHLVLIAKANVQSGTFGVWTTIFGKTK